MRVYTLTIVRHGETQANRDGIIQGHKDVHLSDIGIAQAQLAGNRLKDEKFSHIYSSDLQRALKTAEIIAENNTMARNLTIRQDVRIRERCYGVYEGKSRLVLQKAMKSAKSGPDLWTPPEGETNEQVKQRAIQFFQDVSKEMVQLKSATEACAEDPICPKQFRVANVFNFNSSPESVFSDAADLKNQNSDGTSGLNSNGIEKLETVVNPNETAVPMKIPPKSLCDVDLKNLNSSESDVGGFPNVSLSPLVEQRITRVSRISSGRNSFDDSEYMPPLVGEVLVVTHSGWIRHLISHLQLTLDCKLEGVPMKSRRNIPNTGVSKFIISLTDDGLDKAKATCLMINDGDHLRGHESTEIGEITADKL